MSVGRICIYGELSVLECIELFFIVVIHSQPVFAYEFIRTTNNCESGQTVHISQEMSRMQAKPCNYS